MMGENAGNDEQRLLDSKLPDIIKESKNSKSKILLLYSKEEHTYKDSVQYLISDLDENNIAHEDKIEHFSDHSQVGEYFKPWITKELKRL